MALREVKLTEEEVQALEDVRNQQVDEDLRRKIVEARAQLEQLLEEKASLFLEVEHLQAQYQSKLQSLIFRAGQAFALQKVLEIAQKSIPHRVEREEEGKALAEALERSMPSEIKDRIFHLEEVLEQEYAPNDPAVKELLQVIEDLKNASAIIGYHLGKIVQTRSLGNLLLPQLDQLMSDIQALKEQYLKSLPIALETG